MQNLKRMIGSYIQKVTLATAGIILMFMLIIQVLAEQGTARTHAQGVFEQMEHILNDNEEELVTIREEYAESCLNNAEAIAYIIQQQPAVVQDLVEMKRIARFTGVDEIHIIDDSGVIVAGTHPEYYGYTFDSGEQIAFFKPMLEDKSLELVQEITPNTGEEKMMQYSAVWSNNGEFIVQVGMEPKNILELTEKNSLSYIFSLLKVHVGANFYAFDAQTGEIVGSTNIDDVGKNLTDIGFNLEIIKNKGESFHATVKGVRSYCVFTLMDGNYIGRTVSNDALYGQIPTTIISLMAGLIIVSYILVYATTRYLNRYVINEIRDINTKLREITAGKYDEDVEVQSSIEFSELSIHINEMVESILDNERKMSYVLEKTKMHIGIYEYNRRGKSVRLTEEFRKIFNLDRTQIQALSANCGALEEFIAKIRDNLIQGEEAIYRLEGEKERYVRIEEYVEYNTTFGIVIDVTEEVLKRQKIETERDIDLLTGLYNRRGVEKRLAELFQSPETLGHGAILVIDADGLKGINDMYGHERGDIYIKRMAEILGNFGSKGSLAARYGGDEFVLFLYQYEDELSLIKEVKSLEELSEHGTAYLGDGMNVPLRFSLGYSMIEKERDFLEIIKKADEKMYENKREHHKNME